MEKILKSKIQKMFVTMLFSVLNLRGTVFLKQHRLLILDFSTKYKKHPFLSCKIGITLSYTKYRMIMDFS